MSSNSYDRDHRYCYCGERSVIRTSWTSENPGRRFRSCIEYEGEGNPECDFFSWVDPPMCRRSTEIIPGLLRKSNVLRAENEELREENIRLVECKKLELEMSDWQRELKSAKMIPRLLQNQMSCMLRLKNCERKILDWLNARRSWS
ncbi:GRF zinc finger containing protein [Striga asiatica]|uniref:GRF zinc finger containing protein n=1 Tax=Striga asiatica TaxID=4170 RepID=A0A5A7Q5H6_STRAF|nr:GRF zinc finger containing protein [Striga asiatica]